MTDAQMCHDPGTGRLKSMPGAMPMRVLVQRERNSRWLNLTVLTILIAIIALDLSIFFKRDRPDSRSAAEEARVAGIIESWLKDQRKGGDGFQFWASGDVVEPTQFYSVRSWRVIHIEPFDHAIVEVGSLTEGGEAISKVWKIYLGIGQGGAQLITRIVDAGDGSPPSPSLAKRQESVLARKVRLEKEEAEAKLAEQTRREKEEAKAHLERLSVKIHDLENETDRKLGGLTKSLDRQKVETDRQTAEQTQWLQRMAEQIDQTKRDLVAAKGRATPVPRVGVRLVLPQADDLDLNRVKEPAPAGPAPIPNDRGYEYFLRLAEDFYRGGHYKEAASIFSELIERNPSARMAYLRRGDCFGSMQNFDGAIADFAMAIRLMPKDPRAYLARSWAYLGKGATDLAMTDAEEALRLDPTLAEARLIRTEAFARKGQPDQAKAERSEALATFCRRGIASIEKREYDPGIADLERVIREAPDHVEAHAWCAKGYYLRSDFPNAIKEFTKAIALEPNNKQTYNDRGAAYTQTRDFSAAISDFDRAIRLDPRFHEAYLNRGTARLHAGDLAQAVADLSIAIQLDQRSDTAYRLRSMAYDRMGWAAKAANDRDIAESLGR
jgi:tetratricopeptide (TPR) repeat protein